MILQRVRLASEHIDCTHHRLVKTTPNPRATKKSRGELGPLPPLSAVLVAAAPEEVAEAKAELLEVAMLTVLDYAVSLSAAYAEAV